MSSDSNIKAGHPSNAPEATGENKVEGFVRQVGKRLDSHRSWNLTFWTACIAGGIMSLIALAYVWPGYQVPKMLYAVVFGVAALFAFGAWAFVRTSDEKAASFTDRFFGLKNAVLSCLNFTKQGKAGGFYDLQSKQTGELVADASIEKLQYKPPYRVIMLAVLFLGISVSLGFKGPSPAVVERERVAAATEEMTEVANKELKDLVEELALAVEDDEERKLLEPDKLRKWVDELEQTDDRQEALRQYARLELKLNRAAEMLNQRKDEKLLNTVAEELNKDQASKELAKKLKQKKYELAAKDLKDMKPGNLNEEDLKKLSERRKELAKLKAVANRMADAVRNTQQAGKKQTGNSKKSASEKSSDAKMAESRNGKTNSSNSESESEGEPSDADQNELESMIEELEDAIEELDEALEMAELEESDGNEQDLEECEDCEECDAATRAELDELAEKLTKMARKRKARMKLKQLSQKCSQCQSLGSARGKAKGPGGKEAGEGSDDSSRDQRDENINNDQYTKLKGIKGNGPSLTKIESANDGTGTSNLSREARNREFKRQFESFVGREDVPEDLKAGVKNYFTNIHQSDSDDDSSDKDDGSGEQ